MKIFDFEELFGCEFGTRDNLTKYPDVGDDREFGIRIVTPNHPEDDVRLGVSTMAFVFNKNFELVMTKDGEELYESNLQLSFFVNLDPEDPAPRTVRDGSQKEPYIVSRETHLMPNTEYIYIMRDYNTNNPMGVVYHGLDSDEDIESYNGLPLDLNGVPGIWYPTNT